MALIRNDKKIDLNRLGDVIKERYFYNDGKLYWKRPFKNLFGEAGSLCPTTGYRKIKIKNITFPVHRIVFFIHHNYFPEVVDHIDGDKLNNRIDNLRDAKYQGNNVINAQARSDNTSGYKGVTWHKNVGKWHSSVFKSGKRYYCGVHDCKHEAAKAYNEKAKELFGEFAVLNIIKEN